MKTFILFIIALFSGLTVFAQSPQSFRYQAVARNNSGAVLSNQPVSFQISILSGSVAGTEVYSETHTGKTTNAFGLVELEIGKGMPVTGTFSAINWGSSSYFVQIEMDPSGGSVYQTLSTSQLLSVPYALSAQTAYTADYGNLTNRPVLNLTNWNTAYSWGNHALAGYVPQTRTLNINGNESDLSVNRKWDVGTVTSVGLALPNIFVVSNTPITQTGTLSATWAQQSINQVFASPAIGKGGTPSFRQLVSNDIPGLSWNKITSDKPTTLAGYGITDAATTASVEALLQEIELLKNITGVGSVSDVDGNEYITIKIGAQVWMAENLKTTKFRDGTTIPLVSSGSVWATLATPAFCWNNNDPGNKEIYGALYNWYAVNTLKLCPEGWHVPSDTDWRTLVNFLGGASVAGGKMKETGTAHWAPPNTGATNESNFSALPGGNRQDNGNFYTNIGQYGIWWSSTEVTVNNAIYWFLFYGSDDIGWEDGYMKNSGFCVRCVRD